MIFEVNLSIFLFKNTYLCGPKLISIIMKERGMQSLEMSMVPTNETAIILEDKMMVMDNLNRIQKRDPGKMDDFMNRFPLKLSMSSMMIVIKGKVKFSVNFRDFVADSDTCVIISAGTIIEQVDADDEARIIFLSFSQKDLTSLANIRQHDVHRLYALQVVLLHLAPVQVEMMIKTYQMLRVILEDPIFEMKKEKAAFNCINLMGSIIEQVPSKQSEVSAKASRKDEIVAHFLQCVHDNYREHRDLGFYADQLCLSLKYMSHVVFEQTGRHPSRWIKDYVILDAKTMLRCGRYTVQQVSDELNFPNQSFFGKYFKEAVGVSPKKWK